MIHFSKTLFMDDGDLALVSYDSFKMEIKIYLGKKNTISFFKIINQDERGSLASLVVERC